jgi:hypothetical protein
MAASQCLMVQAIGVSDGFLRARQVLHNIPLLLGDGGLPVSARAVCAGTTMKTLLLLFPFPA